MTQLKLEKLMVALSNADGFRFAASSLRSLDRKDGVSFHTFTPRGQLCSNSGEEPV